jgi:hypothetical protein
MQRTRRLVAAALFLVVVPPIQAQSRSLVGSWRLEYERGLRHENGEITPIMGKGALTLEQRGDSLVGQLLPEAGEDGRTPPPVQFAARASGAAATFITHSKARINMNGDERTVDVTVTWELTARGDTLEGTLRRAMEGADAPSDPAPLKGVRTK